MASRSLAFLLAFVLVFGGLLVAVGHATGETGPTWVVMRTGGNPSSNAVIVPYAPDSSGLWSVQIVNSNLQNLNISVFNADRTILVFWQRFNFADKKPQTVSTMPFFVYGGSSYVLAFVPYGPRGGSAAVTQNFVADLPPVASFTYSPAAPNAGDPITFDASASFDPDGSIVSYSWNFGDGSGLGSGVIMSHTFANAGTYTVTLGVVDNLGGAAASSQLITVKSATDVPPTASFTVSPASPIVGQSATFDASASSDPDGTIVAYAWDFGDGSSTSGASATAVHTFAAVGTFTVTLTVTDNAALTGTTSQSVTVVPDQAPTASFTFSPAAPAAGQSVSFNGGASSDPDGTIVAYSWDFGDGSPAGSGVTPSHSFTNAGTYTVTLTVTDNGGLTGTDAQGLVISVPDVPPTASFTFIPASPIVGETVAFDGSASKDPDGSIASYSWTFGDGGSFSSSTQATASHAYTAGGTYTVTLTVTDNAALTASASTAVTVTDVPPTASFTFSPASPSSLQTITFDATSSSDVDGVIVSYHWDFGDGSTTNLAAATATHAYALPGTYLVSLMVTDNGGKTGTASHSVTVADLAPTASFTFSPSSPVVGQTVSFDASGSADLDGSIASYAWNFGDGSSGSGVTATHAFAAASSYTVVLTVTDNGGLSATATQTVAVSPAADIPPTAAFTFSPLAPHVVQSVNFDGSGSADPDGTIANYAWTFGDGASSPTNAAATASHAYASAGTYTVTLTVTDNGALTGSVSHSITVTDLAPTASFTVSPSSPLALQTVTFDGTGSSDADGSVVAWSWAFGDGATGTGSIATHAYALPGTYSVILTVTDNGGMTGSASQSLVVGDVAPTASFVVTPSTPTATQSATFDASASVDPDGSIVSYAWVFGDGATSTVATPTTTHTYASAGTYTVTLTVTDNGGLHGTASQSVTVTSDLPPVASFTFSPPSPSVGQTVTFSSASSSDPDGTITAYAWTFGDGGTSNLANPTHAYTAGGTFTVTLTVTDNAALTGSSSQSITVTDIPPTAAFSVTTGSPTATFPVSFDASASSDPDGTITTYAWAFGDGGTGSSSSPTTSHVYALPGTYTVTLAVTDNGGQTGSVSHSVVVADAAPSAAFTFSPASPVATFPVSFDGTGSSDPDGTIASYAWAFGDGGTATGATPSHTFVAAGTYTVTLTVTDNGGMTGSVSHSVVVSDAPPTASFTFAPASPVAKQTITFTGSGSDPDGTITAYAWTFGDGGTASTATASHAYATAGTYTVTLTVTDNAGKTGSTSQSVVVADAPPTASFVVTTASPTATQPVGFDASASSDPDGSIVTYAWTFGDGGTASVGTATTSHTYALPGTYTVTLTVTDNGGKSASTSQSVTVADAPPTASFTFSPPSPVATQTITFTGTASDPDGTIVSYGWSFGDGTFATGATATHAYATAATYTVTLTVTDNGGKTATSTQSVVVADAPPTAAFTVTTASPVAASPVNFDGTASSDPDGTITAYAWTFGDGASGTGATLSHTYLLPGTYTVTLTVTDNGGKTGSVSHSVVVADAPPTASFTYSPASPLATQPIAFTGSASDPDGTITAYAWTFGDGGTATGVSPSHTYSVPGSYTVTLTVTDNGGKTGSSSQTVVVGDMPPTASFTFSPATPLFGTPVSFDASGSSDPDGTITTYAWVFGDGGTASLGSPTTSHTYAAGGTFTVTLTVTDNGGKTASLSKSITVVSDIPPTAVLTVTRSQMTVTASGVGSSDADGTVTGYSFAWGDGATTTGASATATHTYATAGPYTITLTVTDNGGMTGTATQGTSVALSTIDYTYSDFYNVPFGEWWDIRTASGYGDEPVGASCFNATSISEGKCTPVTGLQPVASYPYENWAGPGSTSAIYAPYRVKVTGLNVQGYNRSEPVFLPVLNYAVKPLATSYINFNWSMQYEDTANYSLLTNAKGLACYAASNKNDGYHIQSKIYLTMDLQEAGRMFGAPTTSPSAAQTWWASEITAPCSTNGPLETAISNWITNEGNGKYDIYNGYAFTYTPFYTNMSARVLSDGTTQVYIEHAAWGTETLLDRWLYWGNASYTLNYLDSTKARGWWGMENGWWEGVHYVGTLNGAGMNFNLTGVLQYHFQERSAPGANNVYRSSTNLADSDDVPVWTWGAQLLDYPNGLAASSKHPAEYSRYTGLNYIKSTPGSGDYGTNTSFDYTPVSWNPQAGVTWHFVFPTGSRAFYANPATATLGTNLPAAQLPVVTSTLSLWKTWTSNYGTWNPSAGTWDVLGGTTQSWPTGAPGSYPFIPYGGIYLMPAGANPGSFVVP